MAKSITRNAIKRAFIELLEEKSLARITVRDIADRCDINRNTFYYHYQDILGLLEEITSEQVDAIVRQYPSISSLEDCLDAVMAFVNSNKRIIAHIFQPGDNNNAFIVSLWRVCEHVVTTYADTVFPDVPISSEDRLLFIKFYKCACFGLVVDWIETGMKDDYADGVRRICSLKKNSVDLIIRNCIETY